MSMNRAVSCVVGRCFLWPVHSLGKTLFAFDLLHFALQGQTCLLLQVTLDFLLLHSNLLWWKGCLLGVFCKVYREHIQQQRHNFANKGLSSKGYGFSSGHVWMWELDCEEGWVPKNWCFVNCGVGEDSTHGHHQMVNTEIRLITFFAAKDRDALVNQQKQGQELTGSYHELRIAKFRLKLKKVGKTTRPFRYDLNQIPDDWLYSGSEK